jgi:hypothetical protein
MLNRDSVVVLLCSGLTLLVACGSSSDARPRLSASISALDFGGVPAGTTQSAKITVTNTSSSTTKQTPLAVLEGAGDELSLQSSCTHPLASQESCSIDVTYAPKAPTSREGTLVVFDDDIDSQELDRWTRAGQPSRAARPSVDLLIPVRGQGDRRDKLAVRETKLDWGVLGSSLETKVIHLSSVGSDPVKTSFVPSGAFEEFGFGSCPDPLGPGESCDLAVWPTPWATGTRQARIDWDRGVSCTLSDVVTAPSETVPQLLQAPTKESLRVVKTWFKGQFVAAGTNGVVLRLGGDNRWSASSVPSGETLNAVGAFGADDYMADNRWFRFLDDERNLVFAAGEGGVTFVSRDGSPFTALAGSTGKAIVTLLVDNDLGGPVKADNLLRPAVHEIRADGVQGRSVALAPPMPWGHAVSLSAPVVAYAPCTIPQLIDIYVLADGTASIDAEGTLKSVDHPDAQNLRSVACAPAPAQGLVLVGANGVVLSSSDGSTWAREPSNTTETLRAVAADWLGNRAAVGDAGTILYSSQGGPWRAMKSPTQKTLYQVNLEAGRGLAAVGDEGTVVKIDRSGL